jgi:hypothetical protein
MYESLAIRCQDLLYFKITGVVYILIYVVYMRNYSDDQKMELQIFTDLHVLSSSEYQKCIVGMPYVCMYVWIDG